MICITTVVVFVVGGARSQRRERALLIATAVGVLFGVVAVITKVTVQRLNEEGPLGTLIVPAPYVVVILGVAATLLQRSEFHAGTLATSVQTMLVLEPLVAVSHGVVVIGRDAVRYTAIRDSRAPGRRGRRDGGGDRRARVATRARSRNISRQRLERRRRTRRGDSARSRAGRPSPRTPPACRFRRRGRRIARRSGRAARHRPLSQTPFCHSQSINIVNKRRCSASTASSSSAQVRRLLGVAVSIAAPLAPFSRVGLPLRPFR